MRKVRKIVKCLSGELSILFGFGDVPVKNSILNIQNNKIKNSNSSIASKISVKMFVVKLISRCSV